MNEQWIRDLAEQFGLNANKVITTGSKVCGFAKFELTGPPEKVLAAWPDVKAKSEAERRGWSFDYVRNSDADGKRYIGIESVWFDNRTDEDRETIAEGDTRYYRDPTAQPT